MTKEETLATTLEKYNYYTIAFSDEPTDVIMTSMGQHEFTELYRDVENRIINPTATTRFADGTISDNIVYEIRQKGLFAELILTTEGFSWN